MIVPAQADFLSNVLEVATSQGASGWVNLGINVIISTIIGGLVLVAVMKVVEYEWGEGFGLGNAFIVVLIINAINIFGIIRYLTTYIPMGALVLPILIWVALIKAFFQDLTWKHALIVGVVGWILSIFIVPYLTGFVYGFIPL